MSCQLKPNEPQSTIDSNLTKTQKTLKLNIAVALLLKFYSFSKSYNMSNRQIMLSKYKKIQVLFKNYIIWQAKFLSTMITIWIRF